MGATTIGDKIAKARKSKNISQAQLADELFISPQAVGKWERGESFPDILTFNKLAELLGVDLNYFSENFPSSVSAQNVPLVSDAPSTSDAPSRSASGSTGDAPSKGASGSTSDTPSSANAAGKPKWDMSQGNWANADFSGLKNLHEKLGSSNLQNCQFIGSDMSRLVLKSNNVDACDFSNSDFSNSRIQSSNLHKDVFKDCTLKQTQITSSNVYGCDFTGANLSGVVFRTSGFEKNVLANAVLNQVSFIETQLVDIVFDGTLEDCLFDRCAFTRVTFHDAVIINTFFKNRTMKKVRFVDCQVDRITYAFLKNANADVSGVAVLPE